MLHKMDIRKWVVSGLLILQLAWIGNHMRLVANDQINPWRLGGYGMYTIPNPSQKMRVYDPNFPDLPVQVKTLQYEAATRFTNPGRAFRCAHVSSASLRSFFDENRNLIGTNLVFVYSERRFVHAPPSVEKETQGVVEVTWQDERSFTYTSRFCGREHTESAALP